MATAAGVASIVTLLHHPWGNAYFATAKCGIGPYSTDERHCWNALCIKSPAPPAACFEGPVVVQHGDAEYAANRMQACAKDLTSQEAWSLRYWPFVVCTEAEYDKGITSAFACAQTVGLDSSALTDCYTGAKGDAAVLREAKATIDHPGTPYVQVNGKAVEPPDVLAAVCAAHAGTPKPPGCTEAESRAPWRVVHEPISI